MKEARIFLNFVGVWYCLNLILLFPPIWTLFLPRMYPDATYWIGEPLFQLLKDAWLIVGLQLGAIGMVAFWAAWNPARMAPGIVPVIILVEIFDLLWDLYSIFFGGESVWVGVVTMAIHVVVAVFGLVTLRALSETS